MVRVYMRADDGDTITLLIAADKDGRFDPRAREPLGLFGGTWDRTTYYGEAKMKPEGPVLEWYPGGEETPIDLDAAVLRKGRVLTLRSSEGTFRYQILDVAEV